MANVHLHQADGASLLGALRYLGGPAPTTRSHLGTARCRQGPLQELPADVMLSRSLLRKEQLLAGLRPPCHPKATCQHYLLRRSQHLCFWTMERPSGLTEGQRNPLLMGTMTQTRLLGARGDENESLLPNLQETKRQKAGLSLCWLKVFPRMSPLRRGWAKCSEGLETWAVGPGWLSD